MQEKEESKIRLDILLEFLEVAFHSILYFRNIYPKSIFDLKVKYQIPVHISKHPEVNNYIIECLKTTKKLLHQGSVKQIALIILTKEGVSVEKYCFNLEHPKDECERYDRDEYFVKIEEIFRDYLLKLSVVDLKDIPKRCSFRIQITTNETCSVKLNENIHHANFPWVEADMTNDIQQDLKIIPLKTLSNFFLNVNMFLER